MLTVLHGHSLTKLREMASESVHMWVTSPPYWGLRDYGIPAQVWGGGDMECEHVWGEWSEIHSEREPLASSKTRTTDPSYGGDPSRKFNGNHQKHTAGSFCQKCDAWFGHLGLEPNPELYVRNLVMVLREARRVLRNDGTLWLNLGDSYAGSRSGEKREIPHYDGRDYNVHLSNNRVALEAEQNIPRGGRVKDVRSKQATNRSADFQGPHRTKRIPRGNGRWGGGNNPAVGELKPKDLVGIPWMIAFALRADGWWLRSRLPWIKRNCMPESTHDRPATAIEDVFLLSKSEQYFYDSEAIAVAASAATNARLSQNVAAQIGSERANGGRKTNGNMKAVGRKMSAAGSGIKNNESFNNAVCLMVGARNRRNSDWFFESWKQNQLEEINAWQGLLSDDEGSPLAFIINTQPYKEAHFATFPPYLIQPMILAGTSARGCCSKCGAPWERIVEAGAADLEHQRACGGDLEGEYHGTATKDFETAKAQNASEVKTRILRGMAESKTVGWSPTCKCAGYRVRSTTSRRMETGRVERSPYDVDPKSKFADKSNAARVSMLRNSARARGAEYGTEIGPALKSDQLDLDGTHHGQNARRKETGSFSNDKKSRFSFVASNSTHRREWYRSRWQERINARFPKTVPCTVGDMFGGSGTTGEVALELGRTAILIELNEKYLPLIDRRCDVTPGLALA